MIDREVIKKKLHREFKFNSLIIKSEFVNLIVNTLVDRGFDLSNNEIYDTCVKQLCNSFEKEVECEKSIERSQVEKAIEVCLKSGFDETETIINVIDAFEFPKLHYSLERKLYFIDKKNKAELLSEPDTRAGLYLNRYRAVKNRAQKYFHHKNMFVEGNNQHTMQTIDFLLTISHKELNMNLILGALLQGSNGKYFLEDPTGIVQLDLQHVDFHEGFYCEGCFVLVSGVYEDKILKVSSMLLPPGEVYNDSRILFGNINYFGGKSETPTRQSEKLLDIMNKNPAASICFISDLWLDKSIVFEKLETMFEGYNPEPPVAFVFIGNFLSTSYGSETLPMMKKLFKQLAELVVKYPNVAKISHFVFVPGLNDPSIPCIVPKAALPKTITQEFKKLVPRTFFTSNPCRIQYCTREIVVFKSDLISKFVQESLYKPQKENVPDCLAKTLVSQGHLSPFSLNVQPVHWSLDYTLQLYPLPDLVVIGDKSKEYSGTSRQCKIINPGSFVDYGFQFSCYVPASNTIEDCAL